MGGLRSVESCTGKSAPSKSGFLRTLPNSGAHAFERVMQLQRGVSCTLTCARPGGVAIARGEGRRRKQQRVLNDDEDDGRSTRGRNEEP